MDAILPRLPRSNDPNVLVGFDTNDDAGVYRLDDSTALVQTVDFFTPIVDDPYTFGAIAAANALSDVYAMGGRPLTALSILCYPGKGDLDDLEQILKGGSAKMAEAGCVIVGGHSVSDDEMKFGYAITGLIHPGRILKNAGARAGDLLLLTKPIGTGIISTALKRGIARDEDVKASIESMLRLNAAPQGAHGCTDITGFGLIGHAREMALASGVTLEIDSGTVPLLPGALDYARAGALPGGLKNNRDFASCDVAVRGNLEPEIESLLYDPQTSGGLLISSPSPLAGAVVIGRVVTLQDKAILIA